jgi:hypothetical protein
MTEPELKIEEDKVIESIYALGQPLPIDTVIRYLIYVKNKYPDIPVALLGGGGIHIDVRTAGKHQTELGKAFNPEANPYKKYVVIR